MNQKKPINNEVNVQELYDELANWHVNTGGETIHAKRIKGRFRNLKWISMTSWLIFFIGPYVRWDSHQADPFDIPNRQFHLFSITIHPQDVWMLSLVLILMAMTLFGVTAIAGRVFCGYFCFQTIWTDVFTWIEEKVEGSPQQRRKLDKATLTLEKLKKKLIKHTLWLAIASITGITFAAYFTDSYQLWHDYFTFNADKLAYIILAMFIMGTYLLAGFLREQVCFWLCPYARIQGVMYDRDTILPTYDPERGEPRAKLKASSDNNGDCIDCKLCIAVCPTGIDIRAGQQEGCITCGMCIDACDSIMEQVGRPKKLIRYASAKEMAGEFLASPIKRPRVIVYTGIILISFIGILYGLNNITAIDWHILHQRQPLYTIMSNGAVQNKYTFKILNKRKEDMEVRIMIDGLDGVTVAGLDDKIVLHPDRLVPFNVYLRINPLKLEHEQTPFTFTLQRIDQAQETFHYESVMIRPKR